MTYTQARIIDLLRSGHRLTWFGDNGPEMSGFPFWPSKRTVRAMVAKSLLVWAEPENETLRAAGIRPLVLPEKLSEP